jgi:hypothetical protein
MVAATAPATPQRVVMAAIRRCDGAVAHDVDTARRADDHPGVLPPGVGGGKLRARGRHVKHRLATILGVLVVALVLSGSALAFDCMRVSSSLQGLKQSTQSGNWLLFDMTNGGGGVAEILDFFGVSPTQTQINCFQSAYDSSSGPRYFALGIGVAGGRTGHGPEVLAHQAPDAVLMNGTGIDHFEDTVAPIFESAAPVCLGP